MNPESTATPTQQTPTQTPIPEPHTPPSAKNNWAVSILFLILGIVLGASGLWTYQTYLPYSTNQRVVYPTLSPSPISDPTVNWKTYTNKLDGYSFKYPSEAELDTTQQSIAQVRFIGQKQLSSGKTQAEISDGYSFSVGISGVTNLSLNDFYNTNVRSFRNVCDSPNDIISNPSPTTIGGNEALTYTSSCLGNYMTYLVKKDDRVINLDEMYIGDSIDQPNYKKITDQILSTFRFLGQSEGLDSTKYAGWTDYIGKLFTFKYPEFWSKQGPFVIYSTSPNIRIAIAEDSTLMNECMQRTSVEQKLEYIVQNFQRITSAEACSGGNTSEKEVWLTKDKNSYGPGVQITYSGNDSRSETIVKSLIDSFKFTSQNMNSENQTTIKQIYKQN